MLKTESFTEAAKRSKTKLFTYLDNKRQINIIYKTFLILL